MVSRRNRIVCAIGCLIALVVSSVPAGSQTRRERLERTIEQARQVAELMRGVQQSEDGDEARAYRDVISALDLESIIPFPLPPLDWLPERSQRRRPRQRPQRGRDTQPEPDIPDAVRDHRNPNFAFRTEKPVYQFITYFTRGSGRKTFSTGLYRSGLYRRMAEEIFRQEGVPTDLVWLAQVESLWKPWAVSSASAKGLWQFIPSTGVRFGLERTHWVDERANPIDSTRAAARYLKFLHRRFKGDWMLALAAYNAGEGRVGRAVSKAGRADFWYLHRRGFLPRETRNYVPAILATVLIARNPEKYNFRVRTASEWRFDTVRVDSQTSLESVASTLEASLDEVWGHNPDLRRGVTPPGRYQLRIPPGSRSRFLAGYRRR